MCVLPVGIQRRVVREPCVTLSAKHPDVHVSCAVLPDCTSVLPNVSNTLRAEWTVEDHCLRLLVWFSSQLFVVLWISDREGPQTSERIKVHVVEMSVGSLFGRECEPFSTIITENAEEDLILGMCRYQREHTSQSAAWAVWTFLGPATVVLDRENVCPICPPSRVSANITPPV